MIASAQTLRQVNAISGGIQPLSPFVVRTRHNGLTYGLGPAGYDVRVKKGFY